MGERAGISTESLCFQFSVGWHNNVWPQIKLELIVDIRRFSPLSSQQQDFKYSQLRAVYKYWSDFGHDPNGMSSIIRMTHCGQILAVMGLWPGARAVTPRLTHQPDNTCCRDGPFCQYRPFWIWIKWHDINVRAQERWSSLRLYVRVWSNEASMMWGAEERYLCEPSLYLTLYLHLNIHKIWAVVALNCRHC